MRLGILSQYYLPEIGAPQTRLSDLATRFVRHGHEVIVLTALPSYPQGRIYPGYSRWPTDECLDGVQVFRSTIFPTKSPRAFARMLNYGSFAVSSLLVKGWRVGKLDYLLTESPPLFLGPSGYFISRLSGARWIFNVSDLWPDSIVRLGALRRGPILTACEWLESACYRNAWLVTGQSRGIIEDIGNRFPDVSTYHLSNGVDTSRFKPGLENVSLRSLVRGQGKCIALYAGLHGIAQGLDQILDAAKLVEDEDGLELVLLGEGPEKERLLHRAQQLRLRNVRFLNPESAAKMPAVLSAADIALVPLKSELPGAVPSKLYEAMAAGVPVITVATGEPAEIVRSFGAGIVVAPGDANGIADALRFLCRNPNLRSSFGANGRKAAVTTYDRNLIISRFEAHLLERLSTP